MIAWGLLGVPGVLGCRGGDYLVFLANDPNQLVLHESPAQPAKAQWLTNAVFNTVFVRVTDAVADHIDGSIITPVYSRWTPVNSSGEFLYLNRPLEGADALIYSAVNYALIKALPASITVDGVPEVPFPSSEDVELRWDYTGNFPHRMYYVGGPRFYQYDFQTDTAQLVHDFSRAGEFPGAELVHNDVEGDSSSDSRYWAWMVKGAYAEGRYPMLAIITYDRELDRILGILDVGRYQTLGGHYAELPRPNMVEVSPSGRKAIYHLARCWGLTGEATQWTALSNSVYYASVPEAVEPVSWVEERDPVRVYRDAEDMPAEPGTYYHDRLAERLYVRFREDTVPVERVVYWEYGHRPRDLGTAFDGPHAWNLDFTQPVKVSVSEGHSGWAWSYEGAELFVSQNDRNDWIEAYDIQTGVLRRCQFHGNFGWSTGMHFARMPLKTPGWILMSTSHVGENVDWGDNQLWMLEMMDEPDNPRVWRLGSTHSHELEASVDAHYFSEAFAAMSPSGDRFWWSGQWPGQTNIDTYEMRLPLNWWVDLARANQGPRISSLRITASNQVTLDWASASNRSYAVYASAQVAGPYSLLTNGLPATPPTNVVTVEVNGPQCFYRLGEE